MSDQDCITIHIDGAARGNPGPASFAYVIAGGGQPTVEENGYLGSTTNNVAEYTALVRALERAAQLGGRRLVIYSDSELLVKQMNGEYRVKNESLRELFEEAKALTRPFDSVVLRHVPRSQNSEADRLCNEALNAALKRPAPAAAVRRPASSTTVAAPGPNGSRQDAVREEAVACLRAAAAAWAAGNPNVPSAEQVWDQLWSILEDEGVLRPAPKGRSRTRT
jgi:ribonuclease HI